MNTNNDDVAYQLSIEIAMRANISTDWLIGVSSSVDFHKSSHAMMQRFKKFKAGEIAGFFSFFVVKSILFCFSTFSFRCKVLVSTAAAEEGIDVPGVSAVVSYDAIKQVKSYVQMRGRCRFSLSRFLVFISSENELRRYKQATKVESDLFNWISERPCEIGEQAPFLETVEEQAADHNESVFAYREM
jgi:superfamily II DNA/RNA helicase